MEYSPIFTPTVGYERKVKWRAALPLNWKSICRLTPCLCWDVLCISMCCPKTVECLPSKIFHVHQHKSLKVCSCDVLLFSMWRGFVHKQLESATVILIIKSTTTSATTLLLVIIIIISVWRSPDAEKRRWVKQKHRLLLHSSSSLTNTGSFQQTAAAGPQFKHRCS